MNNNSLKEPLINNTNNIIDKPTDQNMDKNNKNNEPCCDCNCSGDDWRDLCLICFICSHLK